MPGSLETPQQTANRHAQEDAKEKAMMNEYYKNLAKKAAARVFKNTSEVLAEKPTNNQKKAMKKATANNLAAMRGELSSGGKRNKRKTRKAAKKNKRKTRNRR